MARYIDADALYVNIKAECNPYGKPTISFDDGCKVLDMIRRTPTADVAPVVHAHWERKFKREGVYEDLWLYCSNCNSRTAEEYAPYWWTYCPYCGAIMDEKEGKE